LLLIEIITTKVHYQEAKKMTTLTDGYIRSYLFAQQDGHDEGRYYKSH
jgi:hypothetical protein